MAKSAWLLLGTTTTLSRLLVCRKQHDEWEEKRLRVKLDIVNTSLAPLQRAHNTFDTIVGRKWKFSMTITRRSWLCSMPRSTRLDKGGASSTVILYIIIAIAPQSI